MSPHIAVVGAGAFGGWTALHLLRRGARVTLLDAWGPGHSRSSSGGETRVLRSVYGQDRLYAQWVARSIELWRENQNRWRIELYRRIGALWMYAVGDAYMREALPVARKLGFRIDPLDRAEAARRFPQIQLDDVDKLYFEHEAGYLRARVACETVRNAFVSEGGSYIQAAVRPGRIDSGEMQPLALSSGELLTADAYVFACGPWLGELFPEAIGDAIQPTRQEVFFFGAPPGNNSFEAENLPIWMDFGERRFYGFPSVDQRGLKVADDVRGPLIDPTSGDRSPSPEGLQAARRFVERRFPALRNAPLVESRVCQYENSPDGHLIVDRHSEAANCWLVGGSGHGFKFSPALGEHVAGLLLDSAAPEPRFAISRLTGLETRATQFGGAE